MAMAGADGPTAGAAAAVRWRGGESLLLLLLRWPSSAELVAAWGAARASAVAPALAAASAACLALSAMLLADAVLMAAACFARRRPDRRYRATPLGAGAGADDDDDDEEAGRVAYPMVLVQIPMYNEREVYKLSIGAACGLSWPSDRLIVQVLDDSTDPTVKTWYDRLRKTLVQQAHPAQADMDVHQSTKRKNKELMTRVPILECDSNHGLASIISSYLIAVGLVELECKSWGNKGKNVKYEVRNTRKGYKAGALKEGLLRDYVQQCNYVAIFDADFQPEPDFLLRTIPYLVRNPQIGLVQAHWEFGTAGVWRISALEEAGGWKDRTTVEDMDLAVRAGLKGWKFVYLADVKVKSELPSNLKTYRHQQHRWTCGAANLFRKVGAEILFTKVTLLVSNNPCSIHFIPFWILFENVMSFHRTKAMFIGLLELGGVNEWVVTEKLGNGSNTKPASQILERPPCRFWDRLTRGWGAPMARRLCASRVIKQVSLFPENCMSGVMIIELFFMP
ncbi:Os06g0230100 [Oryza sativa Japonica Group]|nr:Os06g0230100 [Oryza sativa Japonica Group]|eukprot:NP_001057219.1 Os06g0230100 [Oryza sativa Japonica Group]